MRTFAEALGRDTRYSLRGPRRSSLFTVVCAASDARRAAADPLTYAAVAVLLTAVAALASYLPARRASAVGPAEALAAE